MDRSVGEEGPSLAFFTTVTTYSTYIDSFVSSWWAWDVAFRPGCSRRRRRDRWNGRRRTSIRGMGVSPFWHLHAIWNIRVWNTRVRNLRVSTQKWKIIKGPESLFWKLSFHYLIEKVKGQVLKGMAMGHRKKTPFYLIMRVFFRFT